MLHVWLIPAIMVLAAITWLFYLVIKHRGGTGLRTEGRTVVHKPMDEDDLPPA